MSLLSTVAVASGASLAVWILWPSVRSMLQWLSPWPLLTDDQPTTNVLKYTTGLTNRANDCYINATLQALAGCPNFLAHLSSGTPVSSSLISLAAELTEPITSRRTTNAISVLHQLEVSHNAHFSRRQQDAHEFLHLLLESLNSENMLEHGETEDSIECLLCHRITRKRAQFLVHTIQVPQKSSVNLEHDLLGPQTEIVEDYRCEACGRPAAIRKTTEMAIPPPLLIVHLSRSLYVWGAGGRRNSCSVVIAETLRLAGITYQLQAAVFHAGKHDSGHYDAARRKPRPGRWWKISDTKVWTAATSQITGPQSKSYILFYERSARSVTCA